MLWASVGCISSHVLRCSGTSAATSHRGCRFCCWSSSVLKPSSSSLLQLWCSALRFTRSATMRRRSSASKTRSQRGSGTWDGTEWNPFSGVRRLFCGATHSRAFVWGACWWWPRVAVVAQSFPSDNLGRGMETTHTLAVSKAGFLLHPPWED